MLRYSIKIRINIDGAAGVYQTISDIEQNVYTNDTLPDVTIDVRHNNYKDMLREASGRFGVLGELSAYIVNTLVSHPTAIANTIDLVIVEMCEGVERDLTAITITPKDVQYCSSSEEGGCEFKVSGKNSSQQIVAIENMPITAQYSGGIFDAGNFSAADIVWFGYANIKPNKSTVKGSIPAVFIRSLISNAIGGILANQFLPIAYNGTLDKIYANTSSDWHNAAIANFVVGGVDFTANPEANPSLHEGEVLLNMPDWTLRKLLDNLVDHHITTWRLVGSGGVYSLVIQNRNEWNGGAPILSVKPYFDANYIEKICSDGDIEPLPNRIEYEQATGSPVATNHNRRLYSEYSNFVQNASYNFEPKKMQSVFQGNAFDGDGSAAGREFFEYDTLGPYSALISPVRPYNNFLVVNGDIDANPNEPKILILDPSSPPNGRTVIRRPYTPAELAKVTEYGMTNTTFVSPQEAHNWHEWIDRDLCNLSGAGGFGEGRWGNLKKIDPITYPRQGKLAEVTFCYGCAIMEALGMYDGDTPKVDFPILHYDPISDTEYMGYIHAITVKIGVNIVVTIRY